MATKNIHIKIGCIISPIAQVFRVENLICGVLLKNIIDLIR